MKTTRLQSEAYLLTRNGEHATFVLTEYSTNYYMLAIESSYGGYAYAWSCPGGPFKEFLAGLDWGYLVRKMCPNGDVVDCDATLVNAQREILEQRRERDLTMVEADQEWSLAKQYLGEGLYEAWATQTSLDPTSLLAVKAGPTQEDFRRLYDLFWPTFAEALRDKPLSGQVQYE